jgi:AcrR family transcriptional regulator
MVAASPPPESKDTLTRQRVVAAAMELADERGIEALTMRELGRRLGVEAPSLYNHVAGKDDLLDGLVDLVVAQIDLPAPGAHWKDAMRRRAVSARRIFAQHRWAASLIDSRGRSGPSSLAYANAILGALLGAGFSARRAADVFLVLDSYIYGFERQRTTLMPSDDDDSTEIAQEVLEAAAEAYPALTTVATEFSQTPYDEDAVFDLGLELLLDGFERRLAAG